MAPKYVLGVDGGTGGIRAGLFEIATGAPVGFADTPYDTTHPEPGYAEQNPSDWWDGMGTSVRRVLAETGVAPEDVAAFGAINYGWRHLQWREVSMHPDYPFPDELPHKYAVEKAPLASSSGTAA